MNRRRAWLLALAGTLGAGSMALASFQTSVASFGAAYVAGKRRKRATRT